MTLDRLKELNRQLQVLLADPQPGLMSWHMCLNDTMSSLISEWTKKPRETTNAAH